jgi:SAM-dependent methyltransferase
MDTESVGFDEFAHCLHDLERLNDWSLAGRPTLAWLRRIVPADRPVSLVDIGTGGGGMLRRIDRGARGGGRRITMTGIDLTPPAARAAARRTPAGAPIRFETGDAMAHGAQSVDLIISSLFAHHLTDEELPAFLSWMDRTARIGWFINDLHRHFVPYWFLRGLGRIAPLDPMVVHDGPVSVSRAFVRADWDRLIAQAGLDPESVEVRWYAPFRWGVGTRPGRTPPHA